MPLQFDVPRLRGLGGRRDRRADPQEGPARVEAPTDARIFPGQSLVPTLDGLSARASSAVRPAWVVLPHPGAPKA